MKKRSPSPFFYPVGDFLSSLYRVSGNRDWGLMHMQSRYLRQLLSRRRLTEGHPESREDKKRGRCRRGMLRR